MQGNGEARLSLWPVWWLEERRVAAVQGRAGSAKGVLVQDEG